MLEKFWALSFVALLFIPLEYWTAAEPRQRTLRAGWKTDLLHFLLNDALTRVALVFPLVLLILFLRGFVSAGLQETVQRQPAGLQLTEALSLVILIGYWAHRMQHEVPWLWKFHAVHHSSRELDWLAAVRQHPMDEVFTRSLQFAPLYWLGFSKETFGAAVIFLGLYGLFLHSNTRLRFGCLRHLVAMPEYHRWHHSGERKAYNTNYSILPCVDRLFGTCHMPGVERPAFYGVREDVPQDYWRQLLHPFHKRESRPDVTR